MVTYNTCRHSQQLSGLNFQPEILPFCSAHDVLMTVSWLLWSGIFGPHALGSQTALGEGEGERELIVIDFSFDH